MQQVLVAGDTLTFATSVPQYAATDGWALKYRLTPRLTGTPISLTASAEGGDYRVTVSAATTATWTAGEYSWAAWVEKAGESYTVETGLITVKADPRQAAAGYDGRSLPEKALADAKAALAAFTASKGMVRKYKIGEREMEFRDTADIMLLIEYWTNQVAQEQVAADLAKGLRPKNRILTRFSRPS